MVDIAVQLARKCLGDDLAAAYAIGSLAHGGFSPSASDVDLALLTEGTEPIAHVAAMIAAETARRKPTTLAGRLSIFHAPVTRLSEPPRGARFPAIDRLDLYDHGVLLTGTDRRVEAGPPLREAVAREAVDFFLESVSREVIFGGVASVDDVRGLTKRVLAPVRLAFVVETGRVGSNDDAAAHYDGRWRSLVDAALSWRVDGIRGAAQAANLVRSSLPALHGEILERLAADSHTPRAADLGALASAVAEFGSSGEVVKGP